MLRPFAAALLAAVTAAPAAAQYAVGPSARPQTAMTALGQTNVMARPPVVRQSGYRVAAVNGVVGPQQSGPIKPFSTAANGPTVSPYLNLFRDQDDQAAPNYYTFVQPQVQQIEAAQQQRIDIQRLQRQVQQAAYNRPATNPGPARYGDTGRWYSGWQR